MKRKIVNIISIFLAIISILTTFSYGIFTPYIYEADDERVIAYAELNAAKIYLPSGESIQRTGINGGTEMNVEIITEPIEVVLIIDRSGSMAEKQRIIKAKESSIKLVENLFNVANDIKISVVSFSSIMGSFKPEEENERNKGSGSNNGIKETENAKIEVERSTEQSDINSTINGLVAEGGTQMFPAIEKAEDIFNKIKQEDKENGKETHRFLINLTDGETTDDPKKCFNKLCELEESGIKICNVLIETISKEAFSNNEVEVGTIYDNVSAEELSEIYDEIYNMITLGFVNNNVNDFLENAQNYFIADNNLFMHLDNELLQGSRLDLEYIINIKTAFKCTKIILQEEVDKKLNFSPSSKMISEDKTNSDYGWKINEELSHKKYNDNDYHNLVLSITESSEEDENKESIIERGEPYQVKLLLSGLLTSREDANFQNILSFEVTESENDNIRWEPTGNEEKGKKISQSLRSMEVNIIPPFGEDKSYNKMWILILVSMSAGAGIITYIKRK